MPALVSDLAEGEAAMAFRRRSAAFERIAQHFVQESSSVESQGAEQPGDAVLSQVSVLVAMAHGEGESQAESDAARASEGC